MKRLFYIIFLATTFSLISCEKQENVMCEVSFYALLPDGRAIKSMSVDMTPEGNFLRDMNTRQEYDWPVFNAGKCTITVRKGLYIMAFDTKLEREDGTVAKVRFSEFSIPDKARDFTGDTASLTIKLVEL